MRAKNGALRTSTRAILGHQRIERLHVLQRLKVMAGTSRKPSLKMLHGTGIWNRISYPAGLHRSRKVTAPQNHAARRNVACGRNYAADVIHLVECRPVECRPVECRLSDQNPWNRPDPSPFLAAVV